MKNYIGQQSQFTFTSDFETWLAENFKHAKTFKNKIRSMIVQNKRPPENVISGRLTNSKCLKVDNELASLLEVYDGDTWCLKFHSFIGVSHKLKSKINQSVNITFPIEFDNWLTSSYLMGDNFKSRLVMLLKDGTKPPATKRGDYPLQQKTIRIDDELASLLEGFEGKSWNAKFHDACNITTIVRNGNLQKSNQRNYYVSDFHHDQLVSLGKGNASLGLRIVMDQQSIRLSELQRDALMLLGGGSVEEGLKTLVGP